MKTEPPEFSALDLHFAALMQRLAAKPSPELELAARLVSHGRGQGHLCLPLPVLTEAATLKESGVVGAPGDFKPLILDAKSRLYLYRYWEYEQRLAKAIRSRLGQTLAIDSALLDAGLTRLFPTDPGETDWQREAARAAVERRCCVITGGPGTGKTRTVVKVLALLIEQGAERIALTAPTGKAAARLKEALRAGQLDLSCAPGVREKIPDDVTTIHRLLGARPGVTTMRHDKSNPLTADVVVVDEASMVDVPLMARLFDAVPPDARLILLGDRHQLASVEAGQALSDLCGPGTNLVVELRKNYRFAADSGIARLSAAINLGDADQALHLLQDEALSDVTWHPLPRPDQLPRRLVEARLNGWRDRFAVATPEAALAALDREQILCAVHAGPFGRQALNATAEQVLATAGLIAPDHRWYAGRPVMIAQNDHNLGLFNGDTGVVLPDAATAGEMRVYFSAEGQVRRLLPSRLPAHDTVFAMTVHKSQGSEFADVLLVLPERDSPVLTRELLYTAVTRARERVEIWGSEAILRAAISRRTERTSGLFEAIWEAE